MANFSFSSSEIVALCLESVFYGVYVVLFLTCLRVLIKKRKVESGLNIRLLLVSCTLFLLITWHEVIDAVRLVLSFQHSETSTGADLYYAQVTSTLSVLKTAVYLVETVVSDLFILYRCYIVWNANWPILILPVILYVADCGTGIAAVYTLTRVSTNVIFNEKQEKVTNSFFSCTLALNAVCTGLIALRIWWSQRQNRETKVSSSLTHVTIILVESGAIYVVTLILLVATYSSHSILFNIFLDLASPVIGIVFSLIIVRVGLGISSDTTRHAHVSTISFSVPSKSSRRTVRSTYTGSGTEYTGTSGRGGSTTAIAFEGSQGSYKMNEIKVDVDVDIEQASV
ncbi:hypothetical protein FA95DRAFT_809781 [Auriscalpium vulgare]|uniref:Uncharacterized protein n=1 Tax=Auriscalpium vulgare TaxID=40419 RepID=A0ACB8R9P3_9AGAM|nr:hypothetical protein FA95DRAFT_809781 [Auriscalpium vulgare]